MLASLGTSAASPSASSAMPSRHLLRLVDGRLIAASAAPLPHAPTIIGSAEWRHWLRRRGSVSYPMRPLPCGASGVAMAGSGDMAGLPCSLSELTWQRVAQFFTTIHLLELAAVCGRVTVFSCAHLCDTPGGATQRADHSGSDEHWQASRSQRSAGRVKSVRRFQATRREIPWRN